MDKVPSAVVLNEKDNVATTLSSLAHGALLSLMPEGIRGDIRAKEEIPFCHKVALCNIARGEPIIKYGQQIGAATQNIACGSLVHVHNMGSCRAQGFFGAPEHAQPWP